jgi:hypothetical protein
MKILRCTCKHDYQDQLYGKGNRAANEMKNGQYRCTVCSSVLGSQVVVNQPVKIVSSEPVKEQPKEVKKEQSKSSHPKKVESKDVRKKDEKPVKKSLKGGKR